MVSLSRCLVMLCVVALATIGHAKSKKEAQATPDAHVPSQHTVEVHHSLHKPHDKSQVYWNFGGSTVLTKNYIRITPASQNRKGWLWNDYPIESNNWEVIFQLSVKSNPHFGGDGFGFWLIDGSQDPTFHQDPSHLNGDVFGMRQDFHGLGVVFDVYDNDGRRDNPMIFVLYNPTGEKTNYNHDNDYADDMYKRMAPGTNAAYQCVASIRNTDEPVSVMVKFLHNILHVYLNTNDGLGFRFCLAVEFDQPFKNHHVAFTGITGQVADAHEIHEVSTKYLDASATADDDNMPAVRGAACSFLSLAFWAIVSIACLGLVFVCGYEISSYRGGKAAGINEVVLCAKINETLLNHFLLHACASVVMLIGLQWLLVVCQLPLLGFRGYLLSKNKLKLSSVDLGGEKVHGGPPLSFATRQHLAMIVYIVSALLSVSGWLSC